MPGPAAKHSSVRARTNRASSAAALTVDPTLSVPDLPAAQWHLATLAWWKSLWSSPMAPEYLDADIHGLYRLAMLQNDFWLATSVTGRLEVVSEIRLQEKRFGLTPIDRRQLQWEIARSDDATARAAKKDRTDTDKRAAERGDADPRAVLRAVQ